MPRTLLPLAPLGARTRPQRGDPVHRGGRCLSCKITISCRATPTVEVLRLANPRIAKQAQSLRPVCNATGATSSRPLTFATLASQIFRVTVERVRTFGNAISPSEPGFRTRYGCRALREEEEDFHQAVKQNVAMLSVQQFLRAKRIDSEEFTIYTNTQDYLNDKHQKQSNSNWRISDKTTRNYITNPDVELFYHSTKSKSKTD